LTDRRRPGDPAPRWCCTIPAPQRIDDAAPCLCLDGCDGWRRPCDPTPRRMALLRASVPMAVPRPQASTAVYPAPPRLDGPALFLSPKFRCPRRVPFYCLIFFWHITIIYGCCSRSLPFYFYLESTSIKSMMIWSEQAGTGV
jgi:hypothetical protein